jgi:predicted secreted protein
MSTFSRSAALALGASLLASLPALADEPRYNQISLRAEVSQQVPRDLMQVTLYSEAQDADPAKLAAQITQTLNKALGQARNVKAVRISLGSRNSHPIYDSKSQKIISWRERAELNLESADFPALSSLTGELLQELKMGGMNFSISPTTRTKSQDALLKEAIDAFKARAQLATQALGGKDYKVVNMNLNSNGYEQPLFPRAAMMMKASADSAPETPFIEAGTSQVSMTADGTIEVLMP